MEFTFKLDESSSQTKMQQLIHAINEAISSGVLNEGDFLPSVNKLSRESGLSRDTVFKAYTTLKQRSVISSTPTKGYFVSHESFKVMVLLDDFSAFKEQLYTSFRTILPENYTVDLLFHHYNPDVFEQLILNSLGRYSMYVVMNIQNDRIEKVVRKIDPNKLLILDMGKPADREIAYIVQDFEQAFYNCLQQGLERIATYDEFNMVFPESTPHPRVAIDTFKGFCQENKLKHAVISRIKNKSIERGQAYLVIKEDDLVYIIKSCKRQGLVLGKDVGLISYNDSPMKEIVGNGITVISVDFEEMGRKAAHFVGNKQKVFETLPPKLIWRDSL
ncbi:GntR family transcriptional regulator [uncultured Sunxiuqinia sp.]|uniref:GntR family transcriptional regulator n=1 Tax=uncultured Sunxiuqinia sp. TaxID=1573825 RepID=UPI0026299589|nr:GntR family transcriptional regulator [uncultured Sunxiuqinia sp.]